MFTENVKFRGAPFEYGDDVLIVPPLPLGLCREYQRKSLDLVPKENETVEESLAKADSRIAVMKEAITKALRRNYPEISNDTVEDFVTQENVNPAFTAAMFGTVPTNTAKSVTEAKTVLEKKRNPASTGNISTAE
jgi:hypothetical protein